MRRPWRLVILSARRPRRRRSAARDVVRFGAGRARAQLRRVGPPSPSVAQPTTGSGGTCARRRPNGAWVRPRRDQVRAGSSSRHRACRAGGGSDREHRRQGTSGSAARRRFGRDPRRKCLRDGGAIDQRAVGAAKVFQERIGRESSPPPHARQLTAGYGRQKSLSGRRPIVIRWRSSLTSTAVPSPRKCTSLPMEPGTGPA
jgi:hypothetical protein